MTTIESCIVNSILNKTNYSNINTSYRIYDNLGQLRVNGGLIAVVYYIETKIVNIEVVARKVTNPLILSRLALLKQINYKLSA